MKPALLAAVLAASTLVGCGPPSGDGLAIFELLKEGDGEPLITGENLSDTARWTYAVRNEANSISQSQDAYYNGSVTLENGVTALRYVTALQVVYEEINERGKYYWGSSDGDLREHPIVQLSYPLKLGKEWTTGIEEEPKLYLFRVEAAEPIETPAGSFMATRVSQLNTDTTEIVTRWIVQGVGMVQRYGNNDQGVKVHTSLLRYSREGGF